MQRLSYSYVKVTLIYFVFYYWSVFDAGEFQPLVTARVINRCFENAGPTTTSN